jgi:hypothetical protein
MPPCHRSKICPHPYGLYGIEACDSYLTLPLKRRTQMDRDPEFLDPPMWFESRTNSYYFEAENLADYYIVWRADNGVGHYVGEYPDGCGYAKTLEAAHASACSQAPLIHI